MFPATSVRLIGDPAPFHHLRAGVRTWDLDGLKLDFVDWFVAMPETPRGAEGGGDMASVQEAVHRLLDDIMDRLRQIKPDILIEFRHFESKRSSTPCVRVFGRVRDSPTSQPATGRQRGERCRRCSRS